MRIELSPTARILASCLLLSGVMACSSDSTSPAEETDLELEAQVSILSPAGTVDQPSWGFVNVPETIYIAAANHDAAEGVRAWRRSSASEEVEIGHARATVPTESVPARIRSDLDPSLAWDFYRIEWQPGWEDRGEWSLRASARDLRGETVSSGIGHLVVSEGDEVFPPRVGFLILPPEGRVGRQFEFDPIGDPEHPLTYDILDSTSHLTVRWDFDDDGAWDVDWDAQLTPLDRPTWVYEAPGDYRVRMEARNTYFNEAAQAEESVRVLP